MQHVTEQAIATATATAVAAADDVGTLPDVSHCFNEKVHDKMRMMREEGMKERLKEIKKEKKKERKGDHFRLFIPTTSSSSSTSSSFIMTDFGLVAYCHQTLL